MLSTDLTWTPLIGWMSLSNEGAAGSQAGLRTASKPLTFALPVRAGEVVVVNAGMHGYLEYPAGAEVRYTLDLRFQKGVPPPPPAVGTLIVSTVTTGADLDTNGYLLSVGNSADGSRRVRIGPNHTLAFQELPSGTVAFELTDVSPNCSVHQPPLQHGGRAGNVHIAAGGLTTLAFAVECVPWPKESGAWALLGVWQATSWEFFADSGRTSYLDDVVAGGLAGTLTVTRTGAAEIQWQWRETYRWWGPDRPTVITGRAMVSTNSLRSAVESGASEFECDWGDCDGPLHGHHDFVRNGDTLVVTRPGPVGYYRLSGPHPAWTRLTLAKGQ